MGHIFISYSRKDEQYVTALVKALENEGFEVWIDREMLTGEEWIQVINHKIDTCDAFVIVMTDYSKESQWVRREVLYAIQERKRIFPLLLQGRLWMLLQDFNYFKVTDGSIPDIKFFNDIEKTVPRSEKWLTSQREKTENASAEKARLEAEELARQKSAKEKAERETDEKATREKKEREAKKLIDELNRKRKQLLREYKWKSFLSNIRYRLIILRAYWLPILLFSISIALLIFLVFYLQKNLPRLTQAFNSTATPSQISTEFSSSNIDTPYPATETGFPTLTVTPTKSVTVTATSLPKEITDDKGVEMVLVPAGNFTMGVNTDDPFSVPANVKPAHQVYLNSYYIDKYEVTNSLYEVCVNTTTCKSPANIGSATRSNYYGNSEFDSYPVIFVDWKMAKTYCEWRGGQLPTEAQWEKAARGTDNRRFPWGYDIDKTFIKIRFLQTPLAPIQEKAT